MSIGRYTRDEIIAQGLDLASCPSVDAHDRPPSMNGLIDPNAYSIKWLQNALDMVHRRFPFSSYVPSIEMMIPGGSTDVVLASDNSKFLPDDFILDVRNGLCFTLGNSTFRCIRKSFQFWLDVYNASLGVNLNTSSLTARVYTIRNKRFQVAPVISTNASATLYYYAMPPVIRAEERPDFPDEWTLVQYIELKAKEYVRAVEIGIPEAFLEKQVGKWKATGLLNDTEYDVVPIENRNVINDASLVNRNYWMGNYAI